MAEQLHLQLVRHRDPRVLQQRDHVIGRRPQHAILEIQQADALHALALGQPEHVGRMHVAQGPGAALGEQRRQQAAPDVFILRPRAGGELHADDMRRVPVDQQVGLDQHGFEIVGRDAIGPAVERQCPAAGRAHAVAPAAPPLARSVRESARRRSDDPLRAEIFEHGEARLGDRRRKFPARKGFARARLRPRRRRGGCFRRDGRCAL